MNYVNELKKLASETFFDDEAHAKPPFSRHRNEPAKGPVRRRKKKLAKIAKKNRQRNRR